MKSAGKARNNGLYRHIRTSKEIIRNLLNYWINYFKSYQDARASFDRLGALTEDAEDRGTLTVGHVESISLSNIAYRYAGKPYLYRDLSVDVEREKPMPLPGRTDAAKARF